VLPIEDLLKLPSFQSAKSPLSVQLPNHYINTVVIAPSLNVKEWGTEKTLAILPSHIFEKATPVELSLFFSDANQSGVSIFVCPKTPTLSHVIHAFQNHGDLRNNVLFLVDKDIPLTDIRKEVQLKLLEDSQQKFAQYRSIHSTFMSFGLKTPTFLESLLFFRERIGFQVSLWNKQNNKWWSTDVDFNQFKVIQRQEVPTRLPNLYQVELRVVQYAFLPHATESQLHISLPEINDENYSLIIHHLKDKIFSEEDWIVIENAVYYFQTEVAKLEAVRKNELQYKNDLVNQLLRGNAKNKKDLIEKAARFQLLPEEQYRVIVCNLIDNQKENQSASKQKLQMSQFMMTMRVEFKQIVYMQQRGQVVFIMENKSDELLKKKFQRILNVLQKDPYFDSTHMNISISNPGEVTDIPKNYLTALGIQRIMKMLKERNQVSTYNDLGVYQFFINSPNLTHFEDAIPPKLLKMHKKEPELTQTLKTFLDHNQNYKKTSEILYVHPKTVRYRMEKIRNDYGFDAEDPQKTLRTRLSLQLLNFLDDE